MAAVVDHPHEMTTDTPASETSPRPVARRGRQLAISLLAMVLLALAILVPAALRRRGEVELSISLAADRVLQGEKLMMTLSVENVFRRGVTVEKWSSRGSEECSGLSDLPLDLALYYRPRPLPVMRHVAEPGDLGRDVLEPGEKMELTCDIANLFGLIKPGEFVLEGSYLRDRWASRSYLRPVARLWSSLVVHDPVRFEVVARRYDDPAKM